MFVGAFSHTPNADAVEWFADAILPSLQRRQRGLVLRVVGPDVPRRLRRLAPSSVKVLGYVADLAPVLDASRVFVAPLRFGAGMKGKIGQSMSQGLPVVTTSVGAEGMFLVDGENALVADAPEAFAHAVDRLVRDDALWTQLSRSGAQLVRQHFSEDAALARLAALFPVARPGNLPAAEAVPALARLRS